MNRESSLYFGGYKQYVHGVSIDNELIQRDLHIETSKSLLEGMKLKDIL